MFRLGHVSDLHFRSFAGARVEQFVGKRAVGTMNLVLNRWRKHRMELLEALRADVRARAVDHLAVTGDLANVSLEGEWREALRWLAAYGAPPEAITVIPGNHDAYVGDVVASGLFERLFAPFQTAELRRDEAAYPFARLREGVALVAVNTSVATGDLGAWGEIGEAQRGRLEALLTAPEVARRVRVVLIHHPPVIHKGGERRNLRDRTALCALLRRTGAELVLHGHDHRDERVVLDGPNGTRIPVIGAGSGSYAGAPERRSRHNVYEIDGRRITLFTYAHDQTIGRYREVRRDVLAG